MKLVVLLLSVVSLCTACGGGDKASPDTQNKISVSEVSSDQLVYRKTSIITVKGQNLNAGINFSHQGCSQITEIAGSTANQKAFSCKIIAAGNVPIVITDGNGNSLYANTVTIPLAAQPQVTMTTSLGTIVIELNPAKAPIKLESANGLSNLRGSIAMARTSVLDSATSQFFINVVDNVALDTNAGGYAVFGKVINGIDVIDKIKVTPTSSRAGFNDVPLTSVVISAILQTQ